MSDLDRLYRRVMMMVGRGRLQTIDDSGVVQLSQVDLGPMDPSGKPLMLRDKTPIAGLFGFSSVPPAKSDVVVLFIGGDHDKSIAIAHNHQASRPTGLAEGDSGLYDIRGYYLRLTQDGLTIDLGGSGNVTIQNAKNINVTCTGTATVTAAAVQLGGTGGKKVVLDGDTVSGGVVHASSTKTTAL